jgi:hypothetical protein
MWLKPPNPNAERAWRCKKRAFPTSNGVEMWWSTPRNASPFTLVLQDLKAFQRIRRGVGPRTLLQPVSYGLLFLTFAGG